ncbi:MAG: glycoside hydrolase family 76 protein [Acetatifactor sp.]|nr:glycoside hydrolase family 76 protein [Acetatifactor sp.]
MMSHNEEMATRFCENVLDLYCHREKGYYLAKFYPKRENEPEVAFLWSYFAALGMMYQINRLFPENVKLRAAYKEMLDNLLYYKNADSNDECAKYHSGKGKHKNMGTGDVFFDDNIWIARNMLFAHEIFGDEAYFQEAIRIVNYTYTGWNEEIGGLVWNETGLGSNATAQELERGLSANACCIIVNAKLYQMTGRQDYLDWALRFYSFCKQMQDKNTKIYYNGIHTVLNEDGTRSNGEINKALYAYNSGSMIIANLILYDITQDREYLADAMESAKAAHGAYLKKQNGISHYEGYPWFTAILAESFEALSGYDSEAVKPYMKVLQESLEFACKEHRNEFGLLPRNLATGFDENCPDDRQLLTQSAYAEIYTLLALME